MTILPTDPDPTEVLSAFMDGENTDPHRLAEALSSPDARAILRDFALIRGEVLSDATRPGKDFYKKMNQLLEPRAPAPRARSWWTSGVRVPSPLLAAAAVTVFLMGLGIWRAANSGSTRVFEQPPAPDRIVEFRRGVDWH